MTFKLIHDVEGMKQMLAEHVLMTHKWAVNGRLYMALIKVLGYEKEKVIQEWLPFANKVGLPNARFYTVEDKLKLLERWWLWVTNRLSLDFDPVCYIYDLIDQETIEITELIDPNELIF